MVLTPSLVFILLSIVLCMGDQDKRLLVNDASLFDQRITHLESVIQQLQSNSAQKESLVKQLTTKVSALESTINTLQQQQQSSTQGSSVFIHWGSRTCQNTTSSQVYTGFAAGGIYTDTGAGSEYICLPDDPIYGSKPRGSSSVTYIYGAEYEGGVNTWGTNSLHQDVPCAVCRSHESTSLMIPGRSMCYAGWTMQYKGYLASSYRGHNVQYNYVCVDEKAEYLRGGSNADYGALLYPVVGKCGSLGCPPYNDKDYISCVACTK